MTPSGAELALAAAWWLAALLIVAGVSKSLRPTETRTSFESLGLRSASRLAVAVPITELVVAAALVVWPPLGGSAAVVLLVAFTVVLVRVVRAGSGASCACFGALGTAPVGWAEVVRNVGLCVLAVLAIGATRARPEPEALLVVGMALFAGSVGLRAGRRLSAG
ncbi:MAG TPA: MauE/DoxX family redox-associated membrane protein [Microthrixaceae bacterium]|nr:MauE/DoxX family redox-associated membrane protein [Microthrixaceae bacterium]